MKRMWSPWRSVHIDSLTAVADDQGPTPSLFTRVAAAANDEENLVLFRGTHVFVLMNLYPYNNGHLLIVPFREVRSYTELSGDEQEEMSIVLDASLRWLTDALRPDGFNVGMNIGAAAGAGMPNHLHMHVVPRWSGDTNFMPTVGDVKVVPEALQDTYRKLRQAVDRWTRSA